MATPNEKIAAGLAAHERKKTGKNIPLNHLAGAPASVSDLTTIASTCDLKARRVVELTQGIESAVEKYETQRAEHWRTAGKVTTDDGITEDQLGDQRRAKLVADEVRKYHMDAAAISADERAKLTAELREARQQIDAVKSMWSDPVAVIKLSTLGSAKRGEYARDLAAAGPVELENLARHAAIVGDKDLGAAVLARMDAMSRNERNSIRISRSDLAESLVAEEHAKATNAIGMAEVAVAEAELAQDAAEGRTVPASRKIELGIKKQMLGLHADDGEPKPTDAKPTDTRPIDKILDAKYPAIPGSGQTGSP